MIFPRVLKRLVALELAFAALVLVGTAGRASSTIDTLIIAERFDGRRGDAANSSAGGGNLQLFEGGYIEAGAAVAGERPPRPADVLAVVSRSLETASANVSAGGSPLAVIVHWGVIRRDFSPLRPPYRLDPNLKSRIAIVSTARIAGTLENHLLRNSPSEYRDPNYPTPYVVSGGELLIARDRASQPRAFLVVSAYDAGALRNQQARLVWRTVLSARDTEAGLDESILTFAHMAADYFGRDHDEVIELNAPISTSAPGGASVTPAAANDAFTRELIRTERMRFSGELMEARQLSLVNAVKPPAK